MKMMTRKLLSTKKRRVMAAIMGVVFVLIITSALYAQDVIYLPIISNNGAGDATSSQQQPEPTHSMYLPNPAQVTDTQPEHTYGQSMWPVPLVGTVWILTAYNDGEHGISRVSPQKGITAIFEADGRLFGYAGCNTYHADYETKNDLLIIGPIETTRQACLAEGTMKQEDRFLAALKMASTYEIKNYQLDIFMADGTLMLSFIGQAKE